MAVPLFRLLPALLLSALLALGVLAGPAAAQVSDPNYDDPSAVEDQWPDGYWDDGGYDEAPAETAPAAPPADGSWPGASPDDPAQWPGGEADPTWGEPEEPEYPTVPLVRTRTVKGETAMLRTDGRAAIPRGAPKRVRLVIAAANRIIGKPYKWGGGHRKLVDRGYDCSGSVGYALIGGKLLTWPMVSGQMAHWERAGKGRWITIYANRGHVYMEVAGLRLDTSSVGDPFGRSGVRWRPPIGKRRGFHTRHPAGL